MKKQIFIIFIFLPFFVAGEISARFPIPNISHKNNSLEWHQRNDHLIPDKKEKDTIILLKQKRNFKSNDIDADGIENNLDPSPYDWREAGYNPFGVLGFLSWRHDWNRHKYAEKDLVEAVELLKEAGVSFVRMDFIWDDIEPSKNKFYFGKYDFIVDLLSRKNIKILAVFSYSSSWAGENWNSPPLDLDNFTDFISVVILRYKDKIKYWEIWNEPNSKTYWQPQDEMKTYTKLLKLCYSAAKKIDPSCKIVLGGMTSDGYFAINNVYKNGGKDFFDIMNIHPFVNPLQKNCLKMILNLYNNLEKLKKKYNDPDKKIWFTEIGCPGIKNRKSSRGWWEGGAVLEKQQAKFLDSIYREVVKLPNVEKIFWAYFRDNQEHFGNDVDYFGLVRWDFSKKPAFEAYKKITARGLRLHKYAK